MMSTQTTPISAEMLLEKANKIIREHEDYLQGKVL